MFGYSEHLVKRCVLISPVALASPRSYPPNMANKKPQKTQADFKHTWFIQEWMALASKRQADMIRELDMSRAVASSVWNGQQYTQTLIDQLAPWLHARPWELLMHPDEAMAIRRMREAAVRIAAESEPMPANDAPKTGTHD